MKDFVPYTDGEKKVIDGAVKEDVSDTISPVHSPDAIFVFAQEMELNGQDGWYTGWWYGGAADGRGTWWRKDGKERIDATWKNGVEHGTGRYIQSEREGDYEEQLQEGEFEYGAPADGRKSYFLSTGSEVRFVWSKQQQQWIVQ